MVRGMCGVQFKDRERSMDLMLMLGLNETTDHLAMASSVRWYGHVLRREDGHVLRSTIDLDVEGQGKKGRSKEEWEVKGRRGGQRKKGRSRKEWEVKGRRGGQRKKGRSIEEGEIKGRRGGQRKKGRSMEEGRSKEEGEVKG